MIVDFNLLDDSSRVWIFQSDEIISDDKIDLINFNLKRKKFFLLMLSVITS